MPAEKSQSSSELDGVPKREERFDLNQAAKKEIEPQYHISVQLLFTPHGHSPRYALGLQEIAQQYFVPDPSVNNIVVMQTSMQYGAIDTGHFQEWIEKTGSNFDGYLQHAATGTGDPLQSSAIAEQREMYEELYQAGFAIDWGAMKFDNELNEIIRREHLFILSCLYALEKIPREYNIKLAVQPFSGRELLRLLAKNKSFFKVKDSTEDKEYADIADFLSNASIATHSEMQGTANIYGNRTSSFEQYLQGIIDEAQASGKQTRLLVPMDKIGEYTTYPNMQRRHESNNNLTLETPKFIASGNYYPDPELSVVAKYIENPAYEMTHEDLVKVIASRVFASCLEAMPNNWYTTRGHMMPTVIGRSTLAELEKIIEAAIFAKEEPAQPTEREQQAPAFFQNILNQIQRKPIHERIVDLYTQKAGSLFTYDPMEP